MSPAPAGVDRVSRPSMDSNYLDMTMDQLMERQKFIYKKYTAAVSGGASIAVLNQMLEHMEQIRVALWELGYKESFRHAEKQDQDPFRDSIV